jgi:hypothetical protein
MTAHLTPTLGRAAMGQPSLAKFMCIEMKTAFVGYEATKGVVPG